jgi:hypothetical protein
VRPLQYSADRDWSKIDFFLDHWRTIRVGEQSSVYHYTDDYFYDDDQMPKAWQVV